MKQVFLALLALIIVSIVGLVTTNAAIKYDNIALGNSNDLSLLSKDIKWTPDGHISYVTFPKGNRRFFIAGNQKTYTIDTNTPLSLQEALSKKAVIKENFKPDEKVSYRNRYSTIASVIQTESTNLYHLFAFTQNEEQLKKADGTYDYANFTANIGLLESFDGGNTWKDFGPVIRGSDYLAPGVKITGAGEPSAIVKDGYVYVYFVDWASGVKVQKSDQIYLARTKIYSNGGLGVFEFYTTTGFAPTEANFQPVITIPADSNGKYTSLPSISYNKYLNQYLAIFETNIGFYQAFSLDGITWTKEKLIFAFTKPQSDRTNGDVWYSYPTLLSDNQEKTDSTTANKGNLYFATGTWPNTAHQLTVKSFEFR
jgi:hypothetical protein